MIIGNIYVFNRRPSLLCIFRVRVKSCRKRIQTVQKSCPNRSKPQLFAFLENQLNQINIPNVKALAFIKRMDLAYSVADIVISRAGALSISELTLAGKPSILVPSPNVSEDHQTKNAMFLVNKSAAILVEDKHTDSLLRTALDLLKQENQLNTISKNAKKMGKPNATNDIVNEIFKLIS